MTNNILCIQISTELINADINKNDIGTKYYSELYKTKNKDGYFKGHHFWEIPPWVTELDYNTPVDFYTCTNINDTINHIMHSDYEHIAFSVLDVNKNIIKTIITECNRHEHNSVFVLGGYIDFTKFYLDDTIYPKSIKDFIEFLGIEYKQGYSYKLFKGFKTIPRLTLSTGCTNNCDFCTVEKQIIETSMDGIRQQIESFKPLKFKLIYLNDKTFGQSHSYTLLPMLYDKVKKYNKDFEGFIIQTTTTQFNKFTDMYLFDSHIKYVELGVESFNNNILKRYHKPSTEATTLKAADKIRNYNRLVPSYNIKLIPNIIIGIPEETQKTYNKTLNFLMLYNDIISHYNIYNLAVYDNTPLSKRLKVNDSDKNELTVDKSFHKDKNIHLWFYDKVHKAAIDQLE